MSTAAAPERREAFRLLFLCLVCTGIGQAMLFAILPPAAREIGLTPVQVSIIFVASASIWVFVSPMWGRRSDIVGRRRIILIGLLGFAVSMVCLATTLAGALGGWLPLPWVWPLLIASRCLFALFGSGTGPASQAYVADRTEREERTAGVAMLNAAFASGQTLGPALGAGLALVGLLAPIYASAALAVLSAFMIWLRLPETPPRHAARKVSPRRIKFTDRRIRPFVLISILVQAVRSTTTITLAFFLQDRLGLDALATGRTAGIGFMVLAVAGLSVQALVVQRLKPAPFPMIVSGQGFALGGFVFLVLGHELPMLLIGLGLLGIGLGLSAPGNAAASSLAVAAEEPGAVAGVTGAIGVVGNIFGPLLGTLLYERFPDGPYLLNGFFMTVGLTFALLHPRVRKARP